MPKDTPLRPLLPATHSTPRNEFVRIKRFKVSAACTACRSRKSKCSAERPKCAECISRDIPCEYTDTQDPTLRQRYDDLRSQQNAYKELFNQLVTLPESDSLDLLWRIRAGNDAGHWPIRPLRSQIDRDASAEANIHGVHHNSLKRKNEQLKQRSRNMTDFYGLLQHASEDGANEMFRYMRQVMTPEDVPAYTGQLLNRAYPSPNRMNRNNLPPTNTFLEFELIAQHSNVYPALVPLDIASIDLQVLGIAPFGHLYREEQGFSSVEGTMDPTFKHGQQSLLAPFSTVDGTTRLDRRSSCSSKYVDARLSYIRINHWTDVAVTDELAAQALNLYLVNDTPWWAYFDIDLFLENLVSGEVQFCSRLLLNSVLAWAFQGYAYYEPAALFLVSRFLDEALRIYETEREIDSLTTVAATSLMCMAWIMQGKDKIGRVLLAENARMAERLHLYNVPLTAPPGPLNLEDEDVRTAAAATAWGSFNFQILMSTSYRSDPLVKILPNLPVPGDVHAKDATGRPLPPYQGQVYTSVCKFWSITYEMNHTYFCKGVVRLAAAEVIFQKLLAWADGLQDDITRGEHTPDGVAYLHIWFHTVILDLFQPFASLKPQLQLTTLAGDNATPAMIVNASIKQLKRLIYNYRASSKSANYSIIWQRGMLYLINHILHNFTCKDASFYFLLCMRGYQNLARIAPFISGLVQGIAAMAVQLKAMLPEGAVKLFEEIKSEGKYIHEYMSTYPVDLYSSAADPDTATLENLIHDFRNMIHLESKESDIPEGWRGDHVALFTTLLEEEEEEGTDVKALSSQ